MSKAEHVIAGIVLSKPGEDHHAVEICVQASWQDYDTPEDQILTVCNIKHRAGSPASGSAELPLSDFVVMVDAVASLDMFSEEELDVMQASINKAIVRQQFEGLVGSCANCRGDDPEANNEDAPAEDESFSLKTDSVH